MDRKKIMMEINHHRDILSQLSALKVHISENFPGSTQEERDEIGDVIARVCDREEALVEQLKEKYLFSI